MRIVRLANFRGAALVGLRIASRNWRGDQAAGHEPALGYQVSGTATSGPRRAGDHAARAARRRGGDRGAAARRRLAGCSPPAAWGRR